MMIFEILLKKEKSLFCFAFFKRIFKSNQTIRGENVLGYIEGSDLKDELLIITA